VNRPRLLDLFCGQGGAAMGYHRAGFDVVGVDINLQPNYPFEFHQGDALDYLLAYGDEFDAIHTSPPCQGYSALRSLHTGKHPMLVGAVRLLLQETGVPWVIENVPGAPLIDPVVLCGSHFDLGTTCRDGIYRQLRRHRLFESSERLSVVRSCCHAGQPVGVYGHGGGGQMTRGYKGDKADSLAAMGTPWMDRRGVSQSIPPAYTEHVGRQLIAAMLQSAA